MQCSQCNFHAKVKDDLAGKRVRCPKCRSVLIVPISVAEFQPLEEQPCSTNAPPKASSSKNNRALWIAASVCGILVIAVVGSLLYLGEEGDRGRRGETTVPVETSNTPQPPDRSQQTDTAKNDERKTPSIDEKKLPVPDEPRIAQGDLQSPQDRGPTDIAKTNEPLIPLPEEKRPPIPEEHPLVHEKLPPGQNRLAPSDATKQDQYPAQQPIERKKPSPTENTDPPTQEKDASIDWKDLLKSSFIQNDIAYIIYGLYLRGAATGYSGVIKDGKNIHQEIATAIRNNDGKGAERYASEIEKLLQEGPFLTCRFFPDWSLKKHPLVARREGHPLLLLSGIFSLDVYNDLRTTAKNRAATIANKHILPLLPSMYKALEKTDIEYFGVMVAYGHKDFSEKYASTDKEGLCIVVSKKACKKYVDMDLTDNDLLKQSDIYLYEKTGVLKSDYKKIDLEIK